MGAEIFRESFETGGIDRLIADLAPEFAFYHTALADPTTDRELLRRILVTARKDDRRGLLVHRAVAGDGLHALLWTSTIQGVPAEGVDLVREDDDGRTVEVRITMRPTQAAFAWSAAMTERFGVPHS